MSVNLSADNFVPSLSQMNAAPPFLRTISFPPRDAVHSGSSSSASSAVGPADTSTGHHGSSADTPSASRRPAGFENAILCACTSFRYLKNVLMNDRSDPDRIKQILEAPAVISKFAKLRDAFDPSVDRELPATCNQTLKNRIIQIRILYEKQAEALEGGCGGGSSGKVRISNGTTEYSHAGGLYVVTRGTIPSTGQINDTLNAYLFRIYDKHLQVLHPAPKTPGAVGPVESSSRQSSVISAPTSSSSSSSSSADEESSSMAGGLWQATVADVGGSSGASLLRELSDVYIDELHDMLWCLHRLCDEAPRVGAEGRPGDGTECWSDKYPQTHGSGRTSASVTQLESLSAADSFYATLDENAADVSHTVKLELKRVSGKFLKKLNEVCEIGPTMGTRDVKDTYEKGHNSRNRLEVALWDIYETLNARKPDLTGLMKDAKAGGDALNLSGKESYVDQRMCVNIDDGDGGWTDRLRGMMWDLKITLSLQNEIVKCLTAFYQTDEVGRRNRLASNNLFLIAHLWHIFVLLLERSSSVHTSAGPHRNVSYMCI